MSELRITKRSVNEKGTTFINLFEKRLSKTSNTEKASIVIDVDIYTPNRSDVEKGYSRIPKEDPTGVDKFEVSYKKVKKQAATGGRIHKSYGSFMADLPNLSREDMYKFAMFTLLKNKFKTLSSENTEKIGCKIIHHNEKHFKKQRMGSLKLESYLLSKQRPIKRHGENTCVIDYVWDQVKGKRGFKAYEYDKLKNEIYDFVPEGDMISTEELINWAKECNPRVSIHAFDCRYRNFIRHTNGHPDIVLVYIVKDHHCFPITNENLKIVAAKANQGGCDDLMKHMSELKWSRRHENIDKIETVHEISDMKRENNVIILPKGVKMKEAIEMYVKDTNFYVEYLHWNNRGVLDGFVDHRKNMYLLNEEFDTRKTICDKLFDRYKTHDFKWCN